MKVFLLLYLLLFSSLIYSKNINVLIDKITTQSIGDFYINGFYNSFESAVVNRPGMDLVDYKIFLDKKKDIDTSSCHSDMCMIDVAKILNVDFIIKTNIDILDSNYAISLKLINVKSESVENQIYKIYKNKMPEIIKDSTKSLLKALFLIPPQKILASPSLVVLNNGGKKFIDIKIEPFYADKRLDFEYNKDLVKLEKDTLYFNSVGNTDLKIYSKLDSTISTNVRVVCKSSKSDSSSNSFKFNKKYIRVVAGIVSVLVYGIGLYENNKIVDLQKEYDNAKNIETIEELDKKESDYKFNRNIFYSIGTLSTLTFIVTYKF